MNDFTKEELQLLHAFLYEFVPNFETYDVFKKIQSMIDNYCEAECDHELQLCRCFYGVDEHTYRCNKCLKSHQEIAHDNQ